MTTQTIQCTYYVYCMCIVCLYSVLENSYVFLNDRLCIRVKHAMCFINIVTNWSIMTAKAQMEQVKLQELSLKNMKSTGD